MRLSKAERKAVLNDGMVRRKVVRRKGRALGCGIKRGDVAVLDANTCASVVSVTRDGEEWVFRFQILGSWAIPKGTDHKVSKRAIEDALPGVLAFQEEPNLIVGDIIEFPTHRDKIRDPFSEFTGRDGVRREGGEPISEDVPGLYIEVTSINRGRRGEWLVRYRKHGFDDDEYLAPKLGYTKNPARAMDRDAPVAKLSADPDIQARDEALRERKRLEVLRSGLQQKLVSAKGDGARVVIYKALEETERKIRRMDGNNVRPAA